MTSPIRRPRIAAMASAQYALDTVSAHGTIRTSNPDMTGSVMMGNGLAGRGMVLMGTLVGAGVIFWMILTVVALGGK
jgi:hypothetical protein